MREQQALNKAMMEAVEFVHAEGWDAPPTLFGLVPTQLLVDELVDLDDSSPLTLVVQDLPEHILPGSEELGEYVSRIAWPAEVEGVILAQEIVFKDASAGDGAQPRPARLFSGVLRGEDLDQTLLQLRLSDEELEERGAFAQADIELRGGPGIAPGVLAALRYGLEQDPDELV